MHAHVSPLFPFTRLDLTGPNPAVDHLPLQGIPSFVYGNRSSEVYSPAVDTDVNIFSCACMGGSNKDYLSLLQRP